MIPTSGVYVTEAEWKGYTMTLQQALKAEQAGKDYHLDHPCADYATAKRTARNFYKTELERLLFVAGWNQSFWHPKDD